MQNCVFCSRSACAYLTTGDAPASSVLWHLVTRDDFVVYPRSSEAFIVWALFCSSFTRIVYMEVVALQSAKTNSRFRLLFWLACYVAALVFNFYCFSALGPLMSAYRFYACVCISALGMYLLSRQLRGCLTLVQPGIFDPTFIRTSTRYLL